MIRGNESTKQSHTCRCSCSARRCDRSARKRCLKSAAASLLALSALCASSSCRFSSGTVRTCMAALRSMLTAAPLFLYGAPDHTAAAAPLIILHSGSRCSATVSSRCSAAPRRVADAQTLQVAISRAHSCMRCLRYTGEALGCQLAEARCGILSQHDRSEFSYTAWQESAQCPACCSRKTGPGHALPQWLPAGSAARRSAAPGQRAWHAQSPPLAGCQ